MTITQKEIDELDLLELTAFMHDGANPLMGHGTAEGFFVGKPFAMSTVSVCAMWCWIRDNSPFTLRLEYSFEKVSHYVVKFLDKKNIDENGQVVVLKTIPATMITGGSSGCGEHTAAHVYFVKEIFKTIGKWVEEKNAI